MRTSSEFGLLTKDDRRILWDRRTQGARHHSSLPSVEGFPPLRGVPMPDITPTVWEFVEELDPIDTESGVDELVPRWNRSDALGAAALYLSFE